jgi:hypothetical protein
VFETEMVTPVCLFPAVPSPPANGPPTLPGLALHLTVDGTEPVRDSGCGLGNDGAPRVLVDGESDDDGGRDVLIDVPTSLDTSFRAQMFLHHAYPIPLAMLQGHFSTVHLLPPANGPPTLFTMIKTGDGSWCRSMASFVLNWQGCQVKLMADQHEVASVALMFEDYFKLPYLTAVNYNDSFSQMLLAHITKLKRTWTQQQCGSNLPPSDIWKALSTNSTCKGTTPDTTGHKGIVIDVLTDDTWKIISHSNIWPAIDSKTRNMDVVSLLIICFHHDSSHHGEGNAPSNMPIIDPRDLLGHTFLLPQQDDGQCF